MRPPVDERRLLAFLGEVSRSAREPLRLYLTGGSSQVLRGLRNSTIDIDLTFEPENDQILRTMVQLKDSMDINVELVSPAHFVPPLPGWRDRCEPAMQLGRLTVLHFDPYTQALSKLERGHARDMADVQSLVQQGIIEPKRLLSLFAEVRDELFRYPAIDPPTLTAAVERLARENPSSD